MSNGFQINAFMMEISGFTGGMASTNGYLIRSAGKYWVVDAPEGMAGWLRGQRVKVDALLLTHQHYDHVQDAAEIQREHGAPLLAWAPYSKDLTLELLLQKFMGLPLSVPAFGVDQLLQGRGEIEVCGVKLKLEHIPGHSTDSVVFISQEERTVFGGDVLFAGSIGRADFPGGDMELLINGIREKLLVLPEDFEIYPGHGPATTIGEERFNNPFLQD
jgi:glyoxylase-like metal-dependent hydrolase (beta-lactamase superfamily II)